jgi:leader peptidase (prepilin peptidase)/N-methyltransferase
MGMAVPLGIAIVLGLAIATFLTFVAIRLPREQSFRGALHCVRCGRPLAAWQVVAVIGWLAQGGRGRCCNRSLPWVILFGEVVYIVTLAVLVLRLGFSFNLFYYALICAVLVVTGVVDWQHRLIYTIPTLGTAAFALVAAPFVAGHSFVNALVGMLVAGILFVVFFVLAQFLFPGRSAPFGLGDVYLSLLLGAAFGLLQLAPMLFVGMILAGVFSLAIMIARALGRSTPTYISYGSFLCLGAIGYLLFST